jgi:hypothetical protein
MPNEDGSPTLKEQIDSAIAPYKDKANQFDNQQSNQTKLNNKVNSIYGTEANNLGANTQQYMGNLRDNLTKNVASADYMNQQSGQANGLMKAQAGLQGTDTTAKDEQSRRSSIYASAGINEAAKRQANQQFGKATANIASGVNKIENQQNALNMASQGLALPADTSGGLTDTLFGWV